MIGYWIVMAIASCAVMAVIVAATGGGLVRRNDLPEERSSRPIVIAALGASDLTGEGTLDPERETWIAQLATQLPDDVSVQSFGIGGAWLSAAYEAQVPNAVAIEPDIVIGWLIVNDLTQGESLDTYVATLDLVLAEITRPGRSVLLGNAPQLWDLPAFAGEPDDIEELRLAVESWNATLVQVASRYGVTIVDLCRNPVTLEDICEDGFHPSPIGHAKLAASFHPHVLNAIELARTARLERAAD